jgi:hypothetical protein
MIFVKKILLKDSLKSSFNILYHIAVVALSATIALSLPFTARFVSRNFMVYWSFIESEMFYLISIEIVIAMLLILFFNYIGRGWVDRKFSNMARSAGMVHLSSEGFFAQRRMKKLKEKQGIARDILITGSTGFSTFVDPKGDLYKVIQNCSGAKIMLLNPYSEGARIRVSSILDPDVTLEKFREQTIKSIDFLKGLKAVQKDIKLKLYEDAPFLKLAILGDYLWMKHYHTGIDIQAVPEYVFEQHNENPVSLYAPFYQYFLIRWNNTDIPEYDLDTDELVYRDIDGNETRREVFIKLEPQVKKGA